MRRFKRIFSKVVSVFREGGIDKVIERIDINCTKNDVYGFYGYTTNTDVVPLNIDEKVNVGFQEIVNWVIPDINIGSGGHMNIFRFISYLEGMGLHNRIYLFQCDRFADNKEFRNFLNEHYVKTLTNPKIEAYYDIADMKYAHATVATGWQTAYYVRQFNNTDHKFYFVQDFEPYFYPMGSEYLLAENTYRFGFFGITAGDWLKDKLKNEYNMRTSSFSFSYDKEIYQKKEKRDNVNRVFFYARPVTPRRAFELGLLALIELSKHITDLEVIFAGWDVSNYEIPFKHLNTGSVKLEELSDLYAQCDLCLVLSTTNLSLLPLEIMASNSVVVCTRGANNEWLINESNAILVSYDPIEIANTLAYYLNNKELLEDRRQKGLSFIRNTDWKKEAQKVYNIITSTIRSSGD